MTLRSITHAIARGGFRLTNRALNPFGVLVSTPGVIHGSPAFSGATKWSRRLWDMESALEMVDDVDGAIVESGVHWGYGILAMLHATRRKPRHIYGFDSFAGHSTPTDADRKGGNFINLGSSFSTTQADVWRTLELGTGFSKNELSERVTLIPGWMQDTMPTFAETAPPIAFVHVDPDFYEPAKATIENLWPLLVPGGAMLIGFLDNPELAGKATAVAEFAPHAPDCDIIEQEIVDTSGAVRPCSFLTKRKLPSVMKRA